MELKNGTIILVTAENVPGLKTGWKYAVVDYGTAGEQSYAVVIADGRRYAIFTDEFEVIS